MLTNVLITVVLSAGNTDNARVGPFAQELKNVDLGEFLPCEVRRGWIPDCRIPGALNPKVLALTFSSV